MLQQNGWRDGLLVHHASKLMTFPISLNCTLCLVVISKCLQSNMPSKHPNISIVIVTMVAFRSKCRWTSVQLSTVQHSCRCSFCYLTAFRGIASMQLVLMDAASFPLTCDLKKDLSSFTYPPLQVLVLSVYLKSLSFCERENEFLHIIFKALSSSIGVLWHISLMVKVVHPL